MIFFMFGFHVHEKAIQIPLILYALNAIESKKKLHLFFLFSFSSGVTLFPLLPEV